MAVGRGVQDGDGVLGNDGPEAVAVRVVGRAFVHYGRRAVGEGAIDDVAVARDPADVGGAPVDVVLLDVEHPLGRRHRSQQVAARRVDDAFGLAGGAAGVEQEQHILAVHGFRLAGHRLAFHQVVPPDVAAVHHLFVGGSGAAQHHHLLDAGRAVQRVVGVLLEGNDAAAPVAAVGGYQQLRLRVVDAVAQRLGAEPAEHDAMGRADAGAGQHGDGQFRRHGQVDGHPVALPYAQALEAVGELADLPQQVTVGVHLPVARLALPDDGGLVAPPVVDVPVDAVVGHVQLAADEPLGEGRAAPVQHCIPLPEPVQLLSQPGPEPLRVGGGLRVNVRVGHVGRRREIGGRREAPLLLKQCVNTAGVLNHRCPPEFYPLDCLSDCTHCCSAAVSFTS